MAVHAQQVVPIAEARQQGEGATVTVEGTVTRAFGDFVRIQDESGSVGASGLTIRQTSGSFFDAVQSGDIARDTVLQVTGTLSEFNGLLQINEGDLADANTRGVDASPPTPLTVDISTLENSGEAYESVLVRVDGLAFSGRQGALAASTTYRAPPPRERASTCAFREPTRRRLRARSRPAVRSTIPAWSGSSIRSRTGAVIN